MTNLIITVDDSKKRLKFTGDKIALGERVAVEVVGIDVDANARLRVLVGDTTIAIGGDWNGANCELNLFTVQAEKIHCGYGRIVLDNPEANKLYGIGELELLPWPKERGDDEPYDLTKFPGLIDEWTKQIDNMEVSAKRVDNGVEIVAWDGKGEKPAAVVLQDGKKGDIGDPLTWDDLTDEQKASLKGAKGDKGDTAAHDLVPCDEDGQFYRLVAVKNENGEMVLALEQEKSDVAPGTNVDINAVLTTTDQTVDGVKTFLQKIKGTIESADTATKATQDGNGKVISSTYLPLAGGTVTGDIQFNKDAYIKKNNSTGYLALSGGAEGYFGGGCIVLRGKNSESGAKGEIILVTNDDASNQKSLVLRPDGTLTWGGKNIAIDGDYLPSKGGALNGTIISSTSDVIRRNGDNVSLCLMGGTGADKGARLVLCGKDHITDPGLTYMEANDGALFTKLLLRPDGQIYTNNKDGIRFNIVRSVNDVKANNNGNVVLPLNFLPLTGGSVSGPIKGTALSGTSNALGKCLLLFTGENNFDGANLQMFSREHPAYSGRFYLRASNKSESSDTNGFEKTLMGTPDGTLQWNGKHIPVIQSGTLSSGTSVTFSAPFRDTNYIILKADGSAISGITKTAAGFTVSAASTFNWFAIGAL